MTSQTKKLISNLKEEIEKFEKEELEFVEELIKNKKQKKYWTRNWSEENRVHLIRICQLQFAEKLMKMRDKEEKERLKKLIEKIKKDVESNRRAINTSKITYKDGEVWIRKNLVMKKVNELSKILDEAIKK